MYELLTIGLAIRRSPAHGVSALATDGVRVQIATPDPALAEEGVRPIEERGAYAAIAPAFCLAGRGGH